MPLFIVSGFIFVMLPSSKLSSRNSTKSSATWSGWSWWCYCRKHQVCASFSCSLLFSSSPSAFSGSCLQTTRSDSEFNTLNSDWWADLQLLAVALKIWVWWGFCSVFLGGLFVCFLIFYIACCWKGYLRNTSALWLSAIYDYILLHASSNGLVVSLRYRP